MIRRHLTLELASAGETAGLKIFRKHLLWYTKGLKGGSQFRQMISAVEDKTLLLEKIHVFFASLASGSGAVDQSIDK